MKREKLLILLSYAGVYIIWGTTYFFIKMSVATIPPLFVVGFRWTIAGLAFIGYALAAGKASARPTPREVFNSLWLGILLLLFSNLFVTVALKKEDSYLAALILAACPIGVAFFDRLLLKKIISGLALSGMVIGVTGVGFLLYNGNAIFSGITPGILLIFSAFFTWSLGTSLGHTVKVPQSLFLNSGIQMLGVGIISFIWMLFKEPQALGSFGSYSMASVAGLLYLTTFGSLGFGAYTYLIKHEPAVRVISYAFVNPVIAVLLGLLIGSEHAVRYLIIGLPLIFIGLFLMLYGDLAVDYVKGRKQLNS